MATRTSATGLDKVTLKKVRLSYVSVKKATSIEDSEPHFRATLVIPKSDKATIKALRDAVEKAKQAGLKELWDGTLPKKYVDPIKDGDEDYDDKPEYENSWVVKASSPKDRKPLLVDKDKRNLRDEFNQDEIDELFYSGAFAHALIGTWAYNNKGVGVSLSLQGLMFCKHGDKFGGAVNAAAGDFAVSDDDFEDDDMM